MILATLAAICSTACHQRDGRLTGLKAALKVKQHADKANRHCQSSRADKGSKMLLGLRKLHAGFTSGRS